MPENHELGALVTAPKTTSALILGVSECPRAPALESLHQCASSARDFETYLRSRLNLESSNILNLFDSDDSSSQQLEQIDEWLRRAVKEGRANDLLVYYTGHGAFAGGDQSYILIVRRTKAGLEGATSIRYSDLALCLKQQAPRARRYLILDCCFAASAVPKHQSSLNQALVRKVEDELPPSGTAVLCSSSAKLVSIAPKGKRHTMFSGALLSSLNDGVPSGPRVLSLEDIGNHARDLIRDEFSIDAVRPELHVPEQQKGNPARVPLFPNPLWTGEQQQSKTIASKPWWQERLSPQLLGLGSGLLAAFSSAYIRYPWGAPDVKDVMYYPPILPALALTVALLVATIPSLNFRIFFAIVAGVALSWAAAWNLVWWGVIVLANWPGLRAEKSIIIVTAPAGLIGAFILTISLDFIGRRRKFSVEQIGIYAASCLLPFGLLPALVFYCGYLTDELPFSIWSVLALYVPWHLQMLIRSEVGPAGTSSYLQGLFFFPRHFRVIFLSSILFIVCVTSFGSTATIHLRRALSNQPIIYSIRDAAYVGSSAEPGRSMLTIKYNVGKTIPEPLTCSMQLMDRTSGKSFAAGETRFHEKFSDESDIFDIPNTAIPTLSIRQICPEAKFEGAWEELKARPDVQPRS